MSPDEKKFIVCKASAGSGKTFKLVSDYLKICFESESPFKFSRILAITFTNKAAAEMKERIIAHLRALSSEKTDENFNGQWMDHYRHVTGFSEEIIRKKARQISATMLHNYSALAISTIDKFTHKLIRNFARDLRIAADFEIQIDSDPNLTKSTEELISLAGYDKEVTQILENYIDLQVTEGSNWLPERDIKKFGKELINEDASVHLEKLKNISFDEFQVIFNMLTRKINVHEKKLADLSERFQDFIKKNNLSYPDFFYKASGPVKHFILLSKKEYFSEKLVIGTRDTNAQADRKFLDKDIAKFQSENILNEVGNLFDQLYEIIRTEQPVYVFYRLMRKNIYNLSLVKQFSDKLKEINETENSILISEFNKIISKVVKDDPAPFIYERIGEKYHHILIDEFQDTSQLQFNNLLPLIDNCLSGNNTCMVVGDPKQAIYRWRGGDIDQFIHLPEINSDFSNNIQNSIRNNYIETNLSENYRSGKTIVDFNNQFFSSYSENLSSEYKKIYSSLHQASKKPGGMVELKLFPDNKEPDKIPISNYCLEKINDCLNDNFDYSDITILTRNKKEGAFLAKHLTDQGIPVISNESLFLSSSDKVLLVMCLVHHLAYPDDPIIHFKLMELYHRCFSHSTDPADYKKKDNKYRFDIDRYFEDNNVSFNRTVLLNKTSYQLVIEITDLFFRTSSDIYLKFLSEYVFTQSKNQPMDVTDLCEWWNENKEKLSILTNRSLNAVRIMTIHASKGLQFPVVIFPFAEWRYKNGKEWLWVNLKDEDIPVHTAIIKSDSSRLDNSNYAHLKNQERDKSNLDDINLIYVAFTRPEERLYIIASEKNNMKQYAPYIQNILERKENLCWQSGNRNKHIRKQRGDQPSIIINNIRLPDWEEKLKLSLQNAGTKTDQNEKFRIKKTGIFLHSVFEKCINITSALEMLDQESETDFIIKENYENLKTEIKNVFGNDFLAGLFGHSGTLSECSVVDITGNTYRPDKVVLSENSAVICDFKTGEEQDKHRKQIAEYGKIFREMNYESVKMYLFYTRKGKLIEIEHV